MQKPDYVVCRLKKKPQKGQKADTPDLDEGEPSGEFMTDLEIPLASATTPAVRISNALSYLLQY